MPGAVAAFLRDLGHVVDAPVPVAEEPPDFMVGVDGAMWGLEITELWWYTEGPVGHSRPLHRFDVSEQLEKRLDTLTKDKRRASWVLILRGPWPGRKARSVLVDAVCKAILADDPSLFLAELVRRAAANMPSTLDPDIRRRCEGLTREVLARRAELNRVQTGRNAVAVLSVPAVDETIPGTNRTTADVAAQLDYELRQTILAKESDLTRWPPLQRAALVLDNRYPAANEGGVAMTLAAQSPETCRFDLIFLVNDDKACVVGGREAPCFPTFAPH